MLSVNFSKSLLTFYFKTEHVQYVESKSGILAKSLTIRSSKSRICMSLFSDNFLLEASKLTYKVVDWGREDLEGLGVSPWMIIYLQSKNTLLHDCGTLNEIRRLVHYRANPAWNTKSKV